MNDLEFEKPIIELEGKIAELRNVGTSNNISISDEITRMETKVNRLKDQIYTKLSASQKVQVARHQNRPHYLDYVGQLIENYTPLAGDRNYAEDHALLGGLGRFRGQSCVIFGHERGHDTESRVKHNFGMARPEGYRKAIRLMEMAEQFNLPVISLVDTAGAYPGMGAEERGQAEAIARSIEKCLSIKVPMISVIIGEGGSGGAIAIASADKVYMLEHSIYSVISPEGCASILWRSADHAEEAASALKLTAQDLKSFGIIDDIIQEPAGGAHREKGAMIDTVGDAIEKGLKDLQKQDPQSLVDTRHEKFLAMGRG